MAPEYHCYQHIRSIGCNSFIYHVLQGIPIVCKPQWHHVGPSWLHRWSPTPHSYKSPLFLGFLSLHLSVSRNLPGILVLIFYKVSSNGVRSEQYNYMSSYLFGNRELHLLHGCSPILVCCFCGDILTNVVRFQSTRHCPNGLVPFQLHRMLDDKHLTLNTHETLCAYIYNIIIVTKS